MSWQMPNHNEKTEEDDWNREEYSISFLIISKINLSSEISYWPWLCNANNSLFPEAVYV